MKNELKTRSWTNTITHHSRCASSSASKDELMEAYDKLKGVVTKSKTPKIFVACPNCLNDDITKMFFHEHVVERRPITNVKDGAIYYGDTADCDYTGQTFLYCTKCGTEFQAPTNAEMKYYLDG